jgi:hypothetical protein
MLKASLRGSEIRLDTWFYHLHGGCAGYNGVNKGTPETIPVACASFDIPKALQVITRGKDQPLSAAIAAAAQAKGLHYVYVPVVSGSITPEQVVAMREALQAAPQPVLAFCRSGARSAQLFSLAQIAV